MTEGQGSSGIKYKLFIGFLVALITIGSAAYYAYTSFEKLLSSVHTLSTPNESVGILQDIMNKIQEADVYMRNYTMTTKDTVIDQYLSKMEEIRIDVDHLKNSRSFDDSPAVIDSLNDILQDKADLMYALVQFKNSAEYDELAEKAMGQISQTIENASPSTGNIVTKSSTEPGIKQSTPQTIQSEADDEASKKKKKDKKEKDEGFLKNIFSGKTRPSDPQDVTVVTLTDTAKSGTSEITIDLSQNPTLEVSEVRKILLEIDKEQEKYNTQLTNRELEILASDKVIMNKLKSLVDRIQQDEKLLMESQYIQAGLNAQSSSRIILYISVAALLFGLLFMGIILNDINRSNRYKHELEQARITAEQLAKAKEEFLANMSHEIRTPLNAIIGFSEQLTQTPLHQTQKNYLKAVQQAGTHLLNTVNDILDISKIEAGKLPLEEKSFRMKDIIEEVCSILRVKAEEKNLKMEFSTDLNCDKYVLGDAFRIMQILYNLTGNAIKFTDKGYVRIECNAEILKNKIEYKIDIIDTGIGIENEKLNLIFDSFTQADNATTRKFGGTGLGLSISKKLTEFMNGSIRVKSETGIGSVFTVMLPLRIAKEEEIEIIKNETSAEKNLTGLEILIVDDEPYNLMLSEVILKKHGAKTTTAISGKEALTKIDSHYFDIILADLQMPEIDGYMLAKKIREKFIDVPLIALTANVMQGETDLIKKAGFNGILLKPYREYELLRMIAEHSPVVIGEDPDKIVNIQPENMDGAALYDLGEVKIFTDNDAVVLVPVLESFIENNGINITQLGACIREKNITGIKNTAHKMLPSYNHFKVYDVITELKYLETLQAVNEEELTKIFAKIESVSTRLFIQLKKEIVSMNKEINV